MRRYERPRIETITPRRIFEDIGPALASIYVGEGGVSSDDSTGTHSGD